jgi:translation initiation factor IF-2
LSKVRVYELAKDLEISSKKLINLLEGLGVEIKNHMSTIDGDTAQLLTDLIAEEQKKNDSSLKKVPVEQKKVSNVSNEQKQKNANSKQTSVKTITLGNNIKVSDFALKLGIEPSKIIKKLMDIGVFATINQDIDFDSASAIANGMGFEVEMDQNYHARADELLQDEAEQPENLVPRPPVVTVMGHVDHGKTSLLDAIRQSKVTSTEAGGITQHIGAYQVNIKDKKIVFLDTPGHEAFTSMRARGAKVTDIAVLVVAADDGVMPQTVEAVNHARAAQVQIIVAINKMDKPNANPDRVKQQLAEAGLVPEDWGGDTIMVPVSAVKKQGIENLLEMIILVAEMAELKENPNKPASGTIIEAQLDKGRGPVATVLVQKGTLKIGDSIVAGSAHGKVRAMIDDKGQRIKKAGPSTPVEVLGLSDVPNAGDLLYTVSDEKLARQIADKRKEKQRELELSSSIKISLDELFSRIQKGDIKDLNIIVKADAQGSMEALKQAIKRLSTDEIHVNVIHGGVGAITETDIKLATASSAIIIGFNVRPETSALRLAENQKVDIRTYRVIYNAIEDIEAAMKGLLEPKYKEMVHGRAEVRATFKVPGFGMVAGCYALDGKINRHDSVRIIRNGVIIHEGKIDSLKRFKDDVREVAAGFEFGLGIEKFNDIKENDIIETYAMEEIDQA